MPEKFKAAFNVQMAIPVWQAVTLLFGCVFTAGVIIQKLNTLIDTVSHTTEKVASMSDRQIVNESKLLTVQAQQSNHEARITALERATWERGK